MNANSKQHPPTKNKEENWLLEVEIKMVHGQPMGKPNSKDTP
jgi:hypothetical protein